MFLNIENMKYINRLNYIIHSTNNIFSFSEINGDGRFQPILKSCALEEVPPNLILSFKNRIITVSICIR